MTDRFDEAKQALESVPANDVWAEAERRAGDGTVTSLASVGSPRRRSGRWLAAAAAVTVVLVGTVAVLADDDDSPVDAGPSVGTNDPAGDVTIYQAEGACELGIASDPLPEPANVSPADTFPQSNGTLVEGSLNATQSYAVRVPGQVVTDLVGERVEDVELHRGTAQLWFQPDAVQVRWFTGSQERCDSFTVTVGGGTEDENRHAAVDLAERVVLPSELSKDEPAAGGNVLAGTEWQLERSSIDGEPTDGPGSVFAFTEDSVEWTDGCNYKSAPYTYADATLTVGLVTTTYKLCEPNPTSDAINAVMTAGPVNVTFEGDLLHLRAGSIELVLERG
jgi:heat shock protein HslJ